MLALLKTASGPGNMALRDIPEPTTPPGWLKLKVYACGVCGSDLHIFHDDIQLPLQPPVVIGHEFSGTVVEVGEGVEGWAFGDRATCEPGIEPCGACISCRTGSYNLCPNKSPIGYVHNGGFTSYCVVPAQYSYPLSDEVSLKAGALLEPMACVVHGVVECTGIRAADVVVVSGPGSIGLLAMQVARVEGGHVIVVGTEGDERRLKLARELGADLTVDVSSEDVAGIVRDLTGGVGADLVLECSGAPAAARMGLQLVRRGGQYTQIGLFSGPFSLDFGLVAYKEVQARGSLGSTWSSWKRSIALLDSGQVRTELLVSDMMPITAWQEAFEKIRERQALKVLLTPVD